MSPRQVSGWCIHQPDTCLAAGMLGQSGSLTHAVRLMALAFNRCEQKVQSS